MVVEFGDRMVEAMGVAVLHGSDAAVVGPPDVTRADCVVTLFVAQPAVNKDANETIETTPSATATRLFRLTPSCLWHVVFSPLQREWTVVGIVSSLTHSYYYSRGGRMVKFRLSRRTDARFSFRV